MTKSTIDSNDELVVQPPSTILMVGLVLMVVLFVGFIIGSIMYYTIANEELKQERIDSERCEIYGGVWLLDKNICDDSVDTFREPYNIEFKYIEHKHRFSWYIAMGGGPAECDSDYILINDARYNLRHYPTCVKTSYYDSIECTETSYSKWYTSKHVCYSYSNEEIIIMNQEKIIANQERLLEDGGITP